MSTENQEVNETVEEVVETTETAPKVEKKQRVVTMKDGSQVNFGVRGNVISSVDTETSTLNFKVITGDTITFDASGIEGQPVDALTEFQKQVYLHGLLAKVKSSLAPIKVEDLVTAITKQLESLAKAEFNVRGAGSEVVTGLTILEKAYAIAKSARSTEHAHWADLDDAKTVEEVQAYFATLTPGEKNKLRANAYVKLELAKLEMEKADSDF